MPFACLGNNPAAEGSTTTTQLPRYGTTAHIHIRNGNNRGVADGSPLVSFGSFIFASNCWQIANRAIVEDNRPGTGTVAATACGSKAPDTIERIDNRCQTFVDRLYGPSFLTCMRQIHGNEYAAIYSLPTAMCSIANFRYCHKSYLPV